MIFLIVLIAIAIRGALCSSEPYYQVAAKHGGDGGYENTFECPNNGAITGINYRAAARVDQIEFICASSHEITTFGPYGGNGGTAGILNCPPGQYISSIYGKSARLLDRLGIRCRRQGDLTGESIAIGEIGADGGTDFSDLGYSIGARPVSILIRSAEEVDAIQITYGNVPMDRLCTDCSEYREEWAPKHGGEGGKMSIFTCPADGVITAIKYRAAELLDSIQFTCTSSLSETIVGPFGGFGGRGPNEDKCPPGSYISSIHGRSAEMVDQIGIRCKRVGQKALNPKWDTHGGTGGSPFDDGDFEMRGLRPVQIRVWYGEKVDAIQIKYSNSPIAMNCKVVKIEVTEKNLITESDGFEVIGITSGSSCSTIDQSLTLQYAQTVSESIGVDTTEGDEINWATEVSLTFTTGVSFGATAEVSVGLTQSVGGSRSWSFTRSKSTSIESQKSHGAEVTYKAPGACVLVGVLSRYKIDRSNLPVKYEFNCDGGTVRSKSGTIKLKSTTYGKADFQDYQHAFISEETCTPEARSCVQALNGNRIIYDPRSLDDALKRCVGVGV